MKLKGLHLSDWLSIGALLAMFWAAVPLYHLCPPFKRWVHRKARLPIL
jgi:hypothetical protein